MMNIMEYQLLDYYSNFPKVKINIESNCPDLKDTAVQWNKK